MTHHDEMLDVFDERLTPAAPMSRDAAHREGRWHQVFHCLIVRTAPPARVLLQRRPHEARSFAGLLDLSATGHLTAGELPTDGVRELREEIGVVAAAAELVPLGTRLMIDGSGEGANREIIHAFLLPFDLPLAEFDLADCEVDGLVEIEVDALLDLLSGASSTVRATEATAEGVRQVAVKATDLVPPVDGYWTVVAVMAERFVAGLRPLAI